jgi:flagellar protein FliO/FliZ
MSEGSLAGTLVRLVLSLATVLTMMVFLARYLRHRQSGTGLGRGTDTQRRKKVPPLQVLTRQGLSRGSSVAVVRVSGQLLLLGVTESTVSLLRELEDVDEPELAPEALGASAPVPGLSFSRDLAGPFVELLRQRTVRRG